MKPTLRCFFVHFGQEFPLKRSEFVKTLWYHQYRKCYWSCALLFCLTRCGLVRAQLMGSTRSSNIARGGSLQSANHWSGRESTMFHDTPTNPQAGVQHYALFRAPVSLTSRCSGTPLRILDLTPFAQFYTPSVASNPYSWPPLRSERLFTR